MNLAELLIDENIDQVLALNTGLEVIVWNKACELATGIKKEDIIGKPVIDFLPEMQQDIAMAEALDAATRGYKSFVPHGLGDDYTEKHFIPLKNDSDTVIGILIITHDVAHRIKAEQELKTLNKSLENFKRIIDSSHDIVITFDVNGVITYWNAAAERLLGYSAEEITGQSLVCLLPENGREQIAGILDALRNDTTIDMVTKQQTKYGTTIDVAVNIFPLIDENNLFIGGCKIGKDITEVLSYQQSIEALNNELTIRNRQLASVNSELHTFTNIAVNSYSETLRQLYLHFEYVVANDARKLSDTGKANIRKAQAAIQKMKLLTSDIIAFTRLNEFDTDIRTIDLNAVMKTVVDDLSGKIDAASVTLTIGPLPEIKGFPFLVSLTFHHLLENAIKFKKERTPLLINISCERNVKGADIVHSLAQAGTYYDVITIHDNGIGFPMGESENIFLIFTRLHAAKYKGSGIGLAICRKAMELHDGFITTRSVPEMGSSFSCYFPVR